MKYLIQTTPSEENKRANILISQDVKDFIEMVANVTVSWGEKTYYINEMSFTIKPVD